MIHTKFRGNRPVGSGEEDFKLFLYHIEVWRPSWSCDQHNVIRFSFLVSRSFYTKFGLNQHSSF